MADWTNIPDATFDPDRPVLGSTHLAIVKNLGALAEGAAGAPRSYLGMFERVSAGDVIRSRIDAQSNSASTTATVAYSVGLIQKGSVRASCNFAIFNPDGANSATATITRYRAGVHTAVASGSVASGGSSLSVDIDVIAGDGIYFFQGITGGSVLCLMTNKRISTAGEDLFPLPAGAVVEGNRSVT